MSLDELLLKVKDVSLSALVWQEDVLTEDDKNKYRESGYFIQHTKEEFEKAFPQIPVECICYGPMISATTCLYFNKNTLAVINAPVQFLDGGKSPFQLEGMLEAIEKQEKRVASGDFTSSMLVLQDSMRIEYFEKLLSLGKPVNDLYGLFIAVYTQGDYGFSNLSAETFEKIVSSKTDAQKSETSSALKALPDVITIYRGQTVKGTPIENAYSWTLDKNVANFFATRRGKEAAELITATVRKEDVVEYITDRHEEEIIVRYKDVTIVDSTTLYGIEKLNELVPAVTTRFQKFKNELASIPFDHESSIHGRLHTLRVLLHCLFLSKVMGLSVADRTALCWASVWHDTGRLHDGVDSDHGYNSAINYKNDCLAASVEPDPVVCFLIEYHSRDDKDGYAEIESNPTLSSQKERVTLLYNIFKDADALDRVRLDIRDLDVNMLRCPESISFTKVARICLEQIKE